MIPRPNGKLFDHEKVSHVLYLGIYKSYKNFHPLIFYRYTRLRGVGADLPHPGWYRVKGREVLSRNKQVHGEIYQCLWSEVLGAIFCFYQICWFWQFCWFPQHNIQLLVSPFCSSQPSVVHWLSSSIFRCLVVRLFVRPAMVTLIQSSLLVAPHPQTHTFSESLW